ncbi:hypothetical protein FQN52_005709 [Onygenales sp. PD_12]|nr:hypothetical protein FQN52_005709 [Onygenales sp. PD_12]KAK2803020.1 hypothetical protein FQN51_004047 [Onygenales sp. PD_10]
MSPIMKSWPLVTALLVLLFGVLASAAPDNTGLVRVSSPANSQLGKLALRAPKGGKGGGGGKSGGGDDDDDDEDGGDGDESWNNCSSGNSCSACFGPEYISCGTGSRICYNPSEESRSEICSRTPPSGLSHSGASHLNGPLALGALGLVVAML